MPVVPAARPSGPFGGPARMPAAGAGALFEDPPASAGGTVLTATFG
ncbi:hypothetical protein ACLQ2R_33040 [Streptosporangium sp. DT93]